MAAGWQRGEDRCLRASPPPHLFPSYNMKGDSGLGKSRGRKSTLCLANCLMKLINGLLEEWGRKVKSLPTLSQSWRESWGWGKQGMQEPPWTWVPIPEKDPQLGQKPVLQGQQW